MSRKDLIPVFSDGQIGACGMESPCKKHFRCVFCGKDFIDDVTVGSDAFPIQDSDFRMHSQGVQAIQNNVHSCPFCGFTDELHEEKLQEEERSEILEHLVSRGFFGEGRKPFTPAQKYALLADITILRNRSSMEIAQVYLYAAWMAEDEADIEMGRRFRQQAEAYLVKALDNHEVDPEKTPLITYLVGELKRRLEKFEEAIVWFSRVKSKDLQLMELCKQQKFFASVKESVNTRMPTEPDRTCWIPV